MSKLLTVLIPTFNNYSLFLKVADIYKTDPRVTVIVSDDSSDKYQMSNIKSECIKNKFLYYEGPKSSPPNNWNFLMGHINTPYFVLNHHDEYPSNLKFIDLLASRKNGLIVLPCSSFSKKKGLHKLNSWQQFIFSKICIKFPNPTLNLILGPTACLVVNSKIKKNLFDNNLKWFVDAEWYYKLFLNARRINLSVKFFSETRIISVQAKNSITFSLKNSLKEQIKKEKRYLNLKGLLPSKFVNFIQKILLFLILSKSKLKQYFFNSSSRDSFQ